MDHVRNSALAALEGGVAGNKSVAGAGAAPGSSCKRGEHKHQERSASCSGRRPAAWWRVRGRSWWSGTSGRGIGRRGWKRTTWSRWAGPYGHGFLFCWHMRLLYAVCAWRPAPSRRHHARS
uniref:Uncharacterized protein n=1 Tax=Oryza nivara TaxID=4536 RepID=A0A0E0GRC2_ORYNI